jgi:hypothetical protein
MGALRMGAIANITPILGLLAGNIVAWLARSELKDGKKYFIFLQHILISTIPVVLLWDNWTGFLAGAITFLILWKIKFTHPLEITPLLAVFPALNQNTIIPLFLYFIPTGTMNWKDKKQILAAIVFVVIILLTT